VGLAVILYAFVMNFLAVMAVVAIMGLMALGCFMPLASEFSLARHAFIAAVAALGAFVASATTGATRGPLLLVFLCMGAGLVIQKRLPVGDGDLVIIGMDFRESQKTVPVSAVVDEGGLERRLDPRDFRQIDIAAKLFLVRGFEVEFLYAVPAEHHNPSLLGMGCVDKHFVGHVKLVAPGPASTSRLSIGTEPRPVLVEGGEATKGARAMLGEGIR
jgi:hypothetical protein